MSLPGRVGGWSLVETLIALAVASIVAAAALRLLLTAGPAFRAFDARVAAARVIRAAQLVLPAELQLLSTGGADSGDLIGAWPESIEVRRARAVHFTCADPASRGAPRLRLALPARFGHRSLRAGDGVLVLADPPTADRPRWLAGIATSARPATCPPAGDPGLDVWVGGVPDSQLRLVPRGSPVMAFELARFVAYRDAKGVHWLGIRRFAAGTHRALGRVEPLLGPLRAGGLRLRYLDSDGRETRDRESVSRLVVTVVPEQQPDDSLTIDIALRNRATRRGRAGAPP